MNDNFRLLIVPGLGNSGPQHWQSLWLDRFAQAQRVVQHDWDTPVLSHWLQSLREAIEASPKPVVLVAHSLAVSLVCHWAQLSPDPKVRAALLVAPADVDSAAHTPDEVRGFAPMPTQRLPFESVVVASQNDPFVAYARAEAFAQAWGSRLVDVGAKGHINAASQLDEWPEGLALLEQLLQHIGAA